MKKTNKLYVIIALVIILIIIPLTIHLLYKVDFGIDILTSTWSSGDMLQYYGSIIGALLAIVGVFITLEHNRKENKNTMKQNIRPYVQTDMKELVFKEDIDKIFETKDFVVFFGLCGNQTIKLNENIGKDFFEKYWLKNKDYKMYYVFKYVIDNIGLGSALNCRVKINSRTVIRSLNIHNEKNLSVYIFINNAYIDKHKDIRLDIYYMDMFEDVVYKQSDELNFIIDLDNDIVCFPNIEEELSKQVIVNIDEYYNDDDSMWVKDLC